MSYPNQEQIGSIEKELEKTEHEFRKASETKDFAAMMQTHNRLCQLVAKLSAAWSDGAPTVFSRFYAAPGQSIAPGGKVQVPPVPKLPAQVAATPAAPVVVPPPPPLLVHALVPPPPILPAQMVMAASPSEKEAQLAHSPGEVGPKTNDQTSEPEEIPDVAVLEKQLAELASKMQQCIEAGDMDGMLRASERMGTLSELMTKAEAIQKEKKKEAAQKSAAVEKITVNAAPDAPIASKKSGGWAAGDTLTLAKKRAEERKKQQRINDSASDSFESVVGEMVEKPPEAVPSESPAEEPGSTVDLLFNDRTKAKITGQAAKPVRKMTQDQLRDKLDQYSFYEILAVPSTASFEELHKSFLRKIRKLNKKLANQTLDSWQFQEFVASLCLAHDVLKYPNARLQYDLVLFGPADGGSSAESTAKKNLMPLKDLLKFSTLISARELSEAIEKHKGDADERDLGVYLVEKGQLSLDEWDSILFAQKLVSAGKLTVAQFELAMQEMRENSIPLLDTLVASEWIRPQDVFSGELM